MRTIFLSLALMLSMLAQAQKPYFLIKAPEKPLPGVHRVAILDFAEENHNHYYDYDGRGKKMTDQLLQEWMKENRGIGKVSISLFKSADGETFQKGVSTAIFSFAERSELQRILEEQKLSNSGIIDDSQAATIGKVLGIDAIISGSTGWTESMESGTNRRTRKVRATISMKVISVQTGQVLAVFSKDNTQSSTQSYDPKTGQWGTMAAGTTLADQAFNILTQEAVNYIAPKFEEKEFKFRKIKVKEHSDMAKKAQDLMDNEDFEGAFTIYKAIVEADPYNAEALANTAAIYCIYGNFARAVEYYKQASDIDASEYKKELDYAQSKLDELPILASIGINPPVNELQGNAHSATAKTCHTRGGKSDRYEVYTGPDAKSSVVSKIPGDTDFEILNMDGEWVMIKLLGGKQGWINKDDVKM